jgi:L-2-amino-thiazoline-4-carboxylic acid hydrolase
LRIDGLIHWSLSLAFRDATGGAVGQCTKQRRNNFRSGVLGSLQCRWIGIGDGHRVQRCIHIAGMQAELGEDRANSLVRRALGDIYRRYGEELWRRKNEKNLGKVVASAFATYARENALDYRVIEQSQDAFEIDVTRCRYAEFYKELGEPELGFLLVCSADFTTAEGFGPDVKLTRTQTIMQGARHCDFRYKRLREPD